MVDVAGKLQVKYIPFAEVGEMITTSEYATGARSSVEKDLTLLKTDLKRIVDDSRAKVGDLTKDKLLEMCKEKGIRCLTKDTRAVLAQKLLDTYIEPNKESVQYSY